MKELWAQIQPLLSSNIVLVAIGGLLAVSVVKKLLKLVGLGVTLLVLWFLIKQSGVDVTQAQQVVQDTVTGIQGLT